MTATQQKVEMWTGDDVIVPYWVVNEYGAPEDLGDFTSFAFSVRDQPRGTLAFATKTAPAGVVPQLPLTAGLLHVVINSADTADYEVGGRKVELYCELEGIKTGTKVKTLAEGPFVLHQSIAGVGVGEEVTP